MAPEGDVRNGVAAEQANKAGGALDLAAPEQDEGNTRSQRTRIPRPYPNVPLSQALELPNAIWRVSAGERVRRLTLLKALDRSPTGGTTREFITNPSKYGLTSGSYAAEWLSLTEEGRVASDPDAEEADRLAARFRLAIESVPPFHLLYNEWVGKRLPSQEVLKDSLKGTYPNEHIQDLVDTFILNAKELGLLQAFAGAETLIPIEQVVEELSDGRKAETQIEAAEEVALRALPGSQVYQPQPATRPMPRPLPAIGAVDWETTCFYITPIGEDGSEIRAHADLFLNSLVEPALRELGLNVVRADRIGSAGMITSQIIDHVLRAKLAIVDLSWHNPNAFYEMALRHASKKPVIQISRKADRLPFDVNQIRTVVIDTTSIYSLIPRLETYRTEIATQARLALADPQSATNPLTIFCPGFHVSIPDE